MKMSKDEKEKFELQTLEKEMQLRTANEEYKNAIKDVKFEKDKMELYKKFKARVTEIKM